MKKTAKKFILGVSQKIASKIVFSIILFHLSLIISIIQLIQKGGKDMGAEFWIDFATRFIIGIFLVVLYLVTSKMIERYYSLMRFQEKMLNDQIWINSVSAIIEYFKMREIEPESQRTLYFNDMVIYIYNKLRKDLPDSPNSTIYSYLAKSFCIKDENEIKDIIERYQEN